MGSSALKVVCVDVGGKRQNHLPHSPVQGAQAICACQSQDGHSPDAHADAATAPLTEEERGRMTCCSQRAGSTLPRSRMRMLSSQTLLATKG